MSLLRSLADRSARVPINMALLKELFASTCRQPSKAEPAPFPAPPSAVPLRRTGCHRTPQPRGNSGGSGVVSRSSSTCSRTRNLIVQRSKTAILPNMLWHNWLRISHRGRYQLSTLSPPSLHALSILSPRSLRPRSTLSPPSLHDPLDQPGGCVTGRWRFTRQRLPVKVTLTGGGAR
jgi:hypothetical protein